MAVFCIGVGGVHKRLFPSFRNSRERVLRWWSVSDFEACRGLTKLIGYVFGPKRFHANKGRASNVNRAPPLLPLITSIDHFSCSFISSPLPGGDKISTVFVWIRAMRRAPLVRACKNEAVELSDSANANPDPNEEGLESS
jgi:hypothetical protein